MVDTFENGFTPRSISFWILILVGMCVVALSLLSDLTGGSPADLFVLGEWSTVGLRVYLWLEGALLAAMITGVGVHVVSAGMTLARVGIAQLFGMPLRRHTRVPPSFGYVFVVLGAGLIALSMSTLVVLNSCRYMRLF